MAAWPRFVRSTRSSLAALGFAVAAQVCLSACAPVAGQRSAARYPSPEPEVAQQPEALLLSAQVSAFGDERPPLAEATSPRRVEGSERELDRLVLVFRHQLDVTSVDPRAFAISRGDGRRVRPVRAILAPADEADENHSLTLFGNFGDAELPPVAIHVIGSLYAETGEDLHGLDAQIHGPEQPDRAVLVERLAAGERRCPGAAQVVRVYWSDRLGPSDAEVLGQVELRFADGQRAAPIELDDHRVDGHRVDGHRVDDHRVDGQGADGQGADAAETQEHRAPTGQLPAQLLRGREDDNVLDLCVDREAAVVHLHIAAGALRDANGHPSAVVDVALQPAALAVPSAATTPIAAN